MERVVVLGSGGAGKSTFATRLGALTGLPVIHLDAEHWRAGWTPMAAEEWRARVAELVHGTRWIMDGNYGGTLETRLAVCDTVVFLDLSRWRCLARVLRRRLRFHGRTRPDMAAGCTEQLDLEFIRWIWRYPIDRRPAILRRLAELSGTKRVVHLRSPRAVARFLDAPASHPR